MLPTIRDRIDSIVRIIFATLIAIGCLMVVKPFGTAIIVGAVIAIVTWPLFERTRKYLGGSSTLASLTLVTALTVLIVLPITALSIISAQKIPVLVSGFREWISTGITIPHSIRDIPYVGPWLFEEISHAIQDQQDLIAAAQKIFDPLGSLLLKGAVILGDGMFQMCVMLFVLFFFYRDGDYLTRKSQALLERVSGNLSTEVGSIIVNTTRSVVFGIVGSAAGQGIVALIGFWIVGAPAPLTLGITVFVLSAVPIGPPLVWGPVAVWLYSQGHYGMALFMVLWGALAVSSVDNFLKPLLISKGASLPLSLIYLGVFGGVFAFGFMGIILGPVLIAVGISMAKTWLSVKNTLGDDDKPTVKTVEELRKISENPLEDLDFEEEREAEKAARKDTKK